MRQNWRAEMLQNRVARIILKKVEIKLLENFTGCAEIGYLFRVLNVYYSAYCINYRNTCMQLPSSFVNQAKNLLGY